MVWWKNVFSHRCKDKFSRKKKEKKNTRVLAAKLHCRTAEETCLAYLSLMLPSQGRHTLDFSVQKQV